MMKVNIGKLGESVDVDVNKLAPNYDDAENYLRASPVLFRIFEYGLTQMLNDCHSNVTEKAYPDTDERRHAVSEAVADKLGDLYNGIVRSFGGGRTSDPVARRATSIAYDKLKAAYKAKPTPWNDAMAAESIDYTESAARNKWFMAKARTLAPKYMDLAKAQVAAEAGDEVDLAAVGL
jgi:hypothetical protein